MSKNRFPRLERLPENLNTEDALRILRRNFEQLVQFFDQNSQLTGFVPISFELTQGATQVKIAHGLGFIPRDILVTRVLAPTGVKLTIHHSLSTTSDLVVSVSGTGTVNLKARMFVGTFNRTEGSEVFEASASTQEVKALF